MHELWICKSIFEIIKQKAKEIECTHIKKIILEIGSLHAIEKNALTFSFNAISAGTIAEHAILDIIELPAQAICESCQQLGPLQQYSDACISCGSHALTIIQGEEFNVKSMVVE